MRSDTVKKGSTRAAHRSLFYAMGYTEDEMKRPLIGICNAQNEIIPGHMGAEGVQMGSRFILAKECHMHQNCKDAIIAATDTDSVVTGLTGTHGAVRGLKNAFTTKYLALEFSCGASEEELMAMFFFIINTETILIFILCIFNSNAIKSVSFILSQNLNL